MRSETTVYAEPAFRGRIGVARADITPPDGIYARNWGAAQHDTAQGVHRPLTATALTLQADARAVPFVLISLDLGWWRSQEDESFVRNGIGERLGLPEANVLVCLTHTHAGPSLCRADAHRDGGGHIAPYLNRLRETCAQIAADALSTASDATLTAGVGACHLAAHRDQKDPDQSARYLTGFAPDTTPSDNTLLVGRVTSQATGNVLATVVNYACHPTTLGPGNRQISPDYVGAMRELVEQETDGAPCLFLQGASGELAPPEQYTSDTAVADAHGRTLGYAALSVSSGLPTPGTRLSYTGAVSSGATLGIWEREAYLPPSAPARAEVVHLTLPLKELPTRATITAELEAAPDVAVAERLRRRLQVRVLVGDGETVPYPVWVWRLGRIALVAHPGEAYSDLQTGLRAGLPDLAVLVVNVANGWYGYLPPAHLYSKELYSVTQTPLAAGCLEAVTNAAREAVRREAMV